MSLEAEIKALREAVEANTAAILGEGGTTKSSGAGKASSGSKGKATTKKEEKKTTVDTVAKRFGAYLSAGSAAAKKAAKANVKKLVDHYGVDRVTEVDEDSFDELLGFLDQFEAGEDPFEDEGGGDDDALV